MVACMLLLTSSCTYTYMFFWLVFLIATEAMEASPPSEAIDCMHVCTCIHACMGSKACMYEVVSPGADGQSVACSSVKLHAPSCTCMNCMHRPPSLHQWKRLVPRTGYHACKIKSRSHSCICLLTCRMCHHCLFHISRSQKSKPNRFDGLTSIPISMHGKKARHAWLPAVSYCNMCGPCMHEIDMHMCIMHADWRYIASIACFQVRGGLTMALWAVDAMMAGWP